MFYILYNIIIQSPNPILWPCQSLAEVYTRVATDLYNLAFASCWSFFNDKQKEFIIKQFNTAIHEPKIPKKVLQTILSLAEFMQHDKEGL